MTTSQNNSVANLLTAWRAHDELRRSGAPIADLYASRRSLEEVRLSTRASVL